MSFVTRVGRAWLLSCFALAITACSGGGGNSSTPLLPWGRYRGGVANTAVGLGSLAENQGVTTALVQLGPDLTVPGIDGVASDPVMLTASTPIIGENELIYLGTTAGILVTKKDGMGKRVFNKCVLPNRTVPVTPAPATPTPIPVGSVSGTAAINVNEDVVFGDDNGRVFAFHDDGMTFNCLWVFPSADTTPLASSIVSSPLLLSNVVDGTIATAYIGSNTGHLLALNGFGTQQWRFPGGSAAFSGPLTSSPDFDGVAIHVAAPDGVLYSLDRGGRLQHQAQVSVPLTDIDLLPSSMSGTSTYAVGLGGRCANTTVGCLEQSECGRVSCNDMGGVGMVTALSPVDEVRWRFATDVPIAGSAAFALQSLNEPVLPTVTRTPEVTPTVNVDPSTPTPTPTQLVLVIEGIVFLVDQEGSVYALKDASGELFEVRPTPGTATPTATFIPGEDTPTPAPTPPPITSEGKLTKVQLGQPVTVTTSPVLSSDLFALFGTAGGELLAIRLDFDRTIPCTNCKVEDRLWVPIPLANNESGGGKVPIRPGDPIVSSPIVDQDGTIYLTAGDVSTGIGMLYSVGTP